MTDTLVSQNGAYTLVMQNDGNVVVYDRGGRAIWASGVDPHPELVPPPIDPVAAVTDTWPRRGLSYYTSLTDPRLDLEGFVARLRDAGATYTRVWLLDAWAINTGTGCYEGWVPWTRASDGRFDLWSVNYAYLDRLHRYVVLMNEAGILPQLSGLDLYTWSDRKQGMLWVPPAQQWCFQRNRQGIFYSSDTAFERIAQTSGEDGFLGHFYQKVVSALAGTVYVVETGNEMPEKPLHYRLRDRWREAGCSGTISTNRQEDTPGQYANMKVGAEFDRIAYHGKRTIAYLDEVYPDEPVYPTFRSFYASRPDPTRIILSSDGCRISTNPDEAYDYDALAVVFRDALSRGFSIEHQSAMKLRGFTENRIDLADLEVEWFRNL